MKLILGTVEFNPKGYADVPPIPTAEVERIFRRARVGGIKFLEGAESYNCDELLNNPYFDLIYKVQHPYNLDRILSRVGRTSLTGLLYHHTLDSLAQVPLEDKRVTYRGSSIYNRQQILGCEAILEVPLNIEQREFETVRADTKLARSVFGRGELLKKYTIKQCLGYVQKNPTVHGVIVGVKTEQELIQILENW